VIQIDDAGWGCLLGPTFIGAYRERTKEFCYGEVALGYFQGGNFADKGYLRETTRVIAALLRELKSPSAERVEKCTGYIFSHAVRNLNRSVRMKKITGPLQLLIEQVGRRYLLDLGVPIGETTSGAKLFGVCFEWVCEDFESREHFVKTGWGSWNRKWRWVAKAKQEDVPILVQARQLDREFARIVGRRLGHLFT